ncbi:exosortase-associated protein EpsI, B-type [Xylophilus sp. GOD-11R]|uniref:exosortase-associated protein EpsI, B-type n=1 Tax=Xylophilus sp. GOD-11R TaxID=3089814 RepID=UPI00298BCE83|nr:exosortase-associated protein EpsI, B-type [Xylophilus sp. GOD-11R]WPB57914.1 EpsI family protein [Xylophilus sp. GOD-11R]
MKRSLRSLMLMGAMLATAAVTWAITPRMHIASTKEPINLKKEIPTSFGDWTEVASAPSLIVDPGRQKVIDRIYSESLSRVYVNSKQYAVMLSVAYGKDQRDGFELHQPEVCYPAQGFSVIDRTPLLLEIAGKPVRAVQMLTQGPRPEPLTYWTVVGERNYQGGISKKLAEMSYGFKGQIPDGMLVRVSSVDGNTATAYAAQLDFANALVSSLPGGFRNRFIGSSQ